MDKKTGGPAFPTDKKIHEITHQEYPSQFPGMNLRDWFAGQALAGLASRYLDLEGQTEEACIRSTASIAGKMADAMLAERDKED